MVSTLRDPAMDRPGRDGHPQHIAEYLANAFIWEQLDVRQIHGQRLDRRAVLDGGGYHFGARSLPHRLTTRTAFALKLILGDHEARHRKIKDLTTNEMVDGLGDEVLLTDRTGLCCLHHHLIRHLHPHQMMALMPFLSARGLLAFLPQALGLTSKAIGGRGQMAVVAIFAETRFQFLHTLGQLSNRRESFLQRRLQVFDFLIFVYTLTVLEFEGQYNGLALLSSYIYIKLSWLLTIMWYDSYPHYSEPVCL